MATADRKISRAELADHLHYGLGDIERIEVFPFDHEDSNVVERIVVQFRDGMSISIGAQPDGATTPLLLATLTEPKRPLLSAAFNLQMASDDEEIPF